MPQPHAGVHDDASGPAVSVVIPAYRRAATIRRAIDSALTQTFDDIEVIVVDDASGDGTADIARAVGDARVRVLEHPRNLGGNAARQTGIDAARGRWIAFLDSDDVWLPEKLSRQMTRLTAAGPDYVMCYSWFDLELSNGEFLPARQVRAEGTASPDFLTHHAVGTFSTMVVSREALRQIGGLDLELPACQDWDLVIRLHGAGGICVVPDVLVHYWHGEGDPHRISTRGPSVVEGHRRVYQKLRALYPGMNPDDVVASQQYVAGALAQQGAVLDVLRVVRDLDPHSLDARRVRHAGRLVARAARKRWQAAER